MVALALWTLLLSQVLNLVYTVSKVGKYRSPNSPSDAAGTVLIFAGYGALAVLALARGVDSDWATGVLWGIVGYCVICTLVTILTINQKLPVITRSRAAVLAVFYLIMIGTIAGALVSL